MRKYIEMKVVAVTMLFSLQFVASLAQGPSLSPILPPAQTPQGQSQEEHCWERIGNCINNNINNTESEPQFDPTSPLFNATEYLCCPLIQQISSAERPCFCSVTIFLQQNPSQVPNVTQLLSTCSIVDSVAFLDSFCLGVEAPIPAAAPMMPPLGT
ncbi:uncharacterized protein LOC125497384 isoform X2 [Beta vulgaris subsp. vulgaris]|uniref:uncharacterized protein LOC125497384 isoform X2 n=1 Tax=Beta vulgaris subsp. vulgaris TaxID=3555 RepID=UPI0020371655|nr:uncharacterized protein LOC125497384 isoform X2 [Beta vulgaris subsp. vulgaris]